MISIGDVLKTEIPRIRSLRRELHRHPELSGEERETARRIRDFLEGTEPDQVLTELGGNGVAFLFEGIESGPTVMLRCELDALPIQEINVFPYRSTRSLVSHKCGHDGHMAMLCGVAVVLNKRKLARGRVILLFQPAEETGVGALRILEDPRFASIGPVDWVFALHNLPRYPLGTVIAKSGVFSCASKGLRVDLEGKTSHAAWPEDGESPAGCLAEIMGGLHGMSNSVKEGESREGPEFSTITVVHATLGEEAFGTAPGDARILATLRTETDSAMEKLTRETLDLVERAAENWGLDHHIGWSDEFVASTNHGAAYDVIKNAARCGGLPFLNMKEAMRASEDFGQFTAQYQGAMFGLGSGENSPQLHNPDYDFPDELLGIGILAFWEILDQVLGPL